MLEEISLQSILTLTISLIITFILKDIISNFISGVMFYLDKYYYEGKEVELDGENFCIKNIGIRKTVFRSHKYRFRIILNSRLKWNKIILLEKSNNNNNKKRLY